jgi:hypothetical protein
VCVCVCVRACVRACVHARLRSYMHAHLVAVWSASGGSDPGRGPPENRSQVLIRIIVAHLRITHSTRKSVRARAHTQTFSITHIDKHTQAHKCVSTHMHTHSVALWISLSTFERARHMEDDGQAPGRQASAAVQDFQPPISVGMYRTTQKQVPDLKPGDEYISLADQGIRAEIVYGDSDRIDWIYSERDRTIGGDLSTSSLSPQQSQPRASEADWTHAELLRAHPDAVSSWNGLQVRI